jgi:hypothetical protein
MSIFDSLGGGTSPQGPTGPPKCSRKGCRENASVALLWNNPKIHAPERRKTWLACAGHADWLENYLSERLLFKERLPLQEAAPGAGSQGE